MSLEYLMMDDGHEAHYKFNPGNKQKYYVFKKREVHGLFNLLLNQLAT